MDPVRRALLLILFASVLAAEPGQARAMTSPERASLPAAKATIRLVRQIAASLERTAEATTPTRAHYVDPLDRPPITGPQVATVHPVLEPHAFRLPPPAREG